ncbi:lactonase family protein [Larsenimonas salina]|uniref:lactonase family protein n=1 Tax=Larsenimonas salina TaxID=1295565 RepID=UPI0020743F64|nr:lactonase family protein [Larsenimonas salina]MCM5705128.1 lactonase family protein [Larsenimonas salina]
MLAYIGCRTTQRRQARGKGIEVYRVEQEGRVWTHVQRVDGLTNPSYLILNRAGNRLYCIHGDRSDISAFSVHPVSGELTLLNQASTGGANPVHLALDPEERFIVVSNHISSSVAVIALESDGRLKGVVDLVELSGTVGPHRVEQPFPKPHANPFTPDGRHVIVPDKGLDCLFVYPFDARRGWLDAEHALKVSSREGAGPRHIDFHPDLPRAYVINELDSTLATYALDIASGGLEPLQILPSTAATFTGNNRAAGVVVAPSGQYVLASNRGEDSLALYRVDPSSGELAYRRTVPSGGRTPRFVGFDPCFGLLHVANEDSDELISFDVAGLADQCIDPVHRLATPSPVCLAFRDD